jgi:hypothetical protein
MDIQEQLDIIEQRRLKFLNETNDEKNTQLIKDSYDEYISAKQINDSSSEQLEEAEINYYKAKYGINYIDKLKEKYKSESTQMIKDKLKAHQDQLSLLNESLNTYKNSEKYSKSINEIKAMHLAKIKSLIQKIRLSNAHTNQQKTFYTEQEEDVINSYIITFNCFIGLFTLCCIYYNLRNPKRLIIVTIFLLSIIFILKPLIYLIKSLFKVQFQFGYDPMKSKLPWILYAFFVLLAIWFWVYIDIFIMLYRRQFVPQTPPLVVQPNPQQAATAALARQTIPPQATALARQTIPQQAAAAALARQARAQAARNARVANLARIAAQAAARPAIAARQAAAAARVARRRRP